MSLLEPINGRLFAFLRCLRSNLAHYGATSLEFPFGAPLDTRLFAAVEIRSERLVGELAMRSEKSVFEAAGVRSSHHDGILIKVQSKMRTIPPENTALNEEEEQ